MASKEIYEPPTPSIGHICFSGEFEFFQIGGDVYRAPIQNNPFDIYGRRGARRWECGRDHFDRFRSVITLVD